MLRLIPSVSVFPRLRRVAIGAACALVALTSLSSVAFAREVYLQSAQNGLYVTEVGGVLAAATPDVRRAVRLDTVKLQRGRVAFRDPRSGRFLRAGVGEKTLLSVASPHIRGWETFEQIRLRGDKIALRSVQNGKYVRVNQGRKARLAARAERPGAATEFRILPARVNTPPSGGRPGTHQGGQQRPGGIDAADIAGQYRITHVAADNGYLVRLGRDLARQASFSLDRSGRVSATVGCNRLSGQLAIRDSRVNQRGPGMSTKMFCRVRAQQVAEANVLTALSNANRVERQGNTVTFTGRGGRPLLPLTRR